VTPRRHLLLTLPWLALAARAQTRLPRVGVIAPWQAPDPRIPTYGALEAGLAEGGWVDGGTVVIEWRYGGGQQERQRPIAEELVRLPVDALFSPGALEVGAARQATTTIPIVGVDLVSDPVRLGYAASLARPGGNLTGIYLDGPGLVGKQLELLRSALPGLKRVAAVGVAGINGAQVLDVGQVAQRLGLALSTLEIARADDLDAAFATALRQGAPAGLVLPSPLISASADRVAALAFQKRWPVITVFPHPAQSGALVAYGPDIRDMWRRAALQLGRMLKGEPVATMPIERPDRFRFVINERTAAALGLTLPPALRVLADEVVQ
jgi:putative tryptophan/tyrosine transport system substrate-binding protein